MRTCSYCGQECDSQIGMARELHTTYWGGKRSGVVHSPNVVTFFCSEDHRNLFISTGAAGGEVQTDRWTNGGED